ncbi:aminotransferase class V-fold PLP-dependent enzyme [Mesorhizobium sp. INR15]|uniref:aminotransferase class V-fold PLP-dependent enzyme n=1 Tax=Mesorhizobium sp. INR15 TaxID=2654248 RepID=UPI0018967C5A|nr:aminotransferase class V-fold PLP-dependent enzyme [Mesorhizobium sp. INR15]QPC89757.1 aminotransferase class V-fold PLP-dependent enzyme [Mesorhizobium sp. INR15]
MIDVKRVREQTASCGRHVHFNNAGASPMADPVKSAVIAHIEKEAEMGGYRAAREASAQIDDFYDAFAALLNCERTEIAYVENATRAWDSVFYGFDFKPGDRVVTCMSEYGSNYLAFLHLARTKGIIIDVAANDASGQVSVAAIRQLITSRTRLIAITHVPTQGGLVNPAEEVGAVARQNGIRFLLDACQSIGHLPLDVKAIGCDFLSGTGRKYLRGPRGTGVLYANMQALAEIHPPFVDIGAAKWVSRDGYELLPDARRFENWEYHVAGKIGLAAAVRYALNLGVDATWARIRGLADMLRGELARDSRIRLGDQGEKKCGIVTFHRDDEHPQDTMRRLEDARVSVSVSEQCDARLDLEARGIASLVRTSVHYFNTEAEIEKVCRIALA